ncbi:uncharacterized protein Bfra_009865 [Botrytis fragariae]|uniref:Uncharacterized protein n=1 Tax=Botrytis fragariae TaxID=1964551 RepID=A0A8H6AN11_9HELO|nr:uncharacterized protein Bfra_009865 [Botrytis fragariae]KAF5870477.1 hypothetical protein Bfra_009865 [Botrytis fragariae]
MSFPSASVPASSPSKNTNKKPSKNNKNSRADNLTGSYNSQYALPGKETSGLNFEIFEDPRCAICDGDLPPTEGPQSHTLPQLCAPCHLQLTHLKNEREKLLRQQRQKQLDQMHEALEAVSAQAELRRVLTDGNERLRGEIVEIEREIGGLEGGVRGRGRGKGRERGER